MFALSNEIPNSKKNGSFYKWLKDLQSNLKLCNYCKYVGVSKSRVTRALKGVQIIRMNKNSS